MMNLDYLLLQSQWAIDPQIGLSYLAKIYQEQSLLGDNYVKTKYEEKLASQKVVLHYGGIQAQVFDDVSGVSASKIDSIAVVQLSGPMHLEDGLCHIGMKTFANTLRILDDMPSVKGIILEINSGGGETNAGQLVYSTVEDLKTPVGALIHTAASAGYMAAAPADFIMGVGNLSRAGSIGTLLTISKEFLRAVKEEYTTIYSDLSPQKNNVSRELLEGIQDSAKAMLNEVSLEFHNAVMKHRMLTYKKKDTLEGALFNAPEAKKRGLIDKVGSYKQAIDLMNKII